MWQARKTAEAHISVKRKNASPRQESPADSNPPWNARSPTPYTNSWPRKSQWNWEFRIENSEWYIRKYPYRNYEPDRYRKTAPVCGAVQAGRGSCQRRRSYWEVPPENTGSRVRPACLRCLRTYREADHWQMQNFMTK